MTPGDGTVHYHNLKWLMDHALRHGARRVSAAKVRWQAAGSCSSPVTRELHAEPPVFDRTERRVIMRDASRMWYTDDPDDTQRGVVVGPGKRHSLLLEMEVPCRKCDNCRARRARMWAIRAMQEFRAGSDVGLRTWFGTLTIDPNRLHIARTRARALVAVDETVDGQTGEIKRDDWDELPEWLAMQKLNSQLSPDITRYLKRVRKGSLPKWAVTLPRYADFEPHETRFRFLCVAELGDKRGRLHYHLLVHEQEHGAEVRHALLETQWAEVGFSNWKIVRTPYGAAHYVSKYLTKRMIARVRASGGYGNNWIEGTVSNHRSYRAGTTTTPTLAGLLPNGPSKTVKSEEQVSNAKLG